MTTTRVGTVNQTVSNSGTGVVYLWKELLKTAGWTVVGSGDGLSAFGSGSDVITSAGAGANGLDNARAWITMGDPGGKRSFTFQRGTASAASWRVLATESIALTGGNATTTMTSPSAVANISGGGTDAAPSFANHFSTAAAPWRVHIVTDPVPVPGSDVYMFYYTINPVGATTQYNLFFVDGLYAGTYAATDTAPWVLLDATNALATTSFGTSGSGNFRAWVASSFSSMQIASSGLSNTGFSANLASASFGPDPIGGLDWMVPLTWVAPSAAGIKGVTYGMRHGLTIRLTGNTLNLSTDPYIYWCGIVSNECLCLPWIDGVAPSL